MKVAVDVDGVLADFHDGAMRIINQLRPGTNITPKNYAPVTRNYWQNFGISDDEFWGRVDATRNWWLSLPAFPENVSALFNFLHSGQHTVILCTSRLETVGMSVERQTWHWIESCGYTRSPLSYLSVVAAPKASRKAPIYKAMGIEYSVDDLGKTVAECNAVEGHQAFLLPRSDSGRFDLPQVQDLEEFFLKIRGIQ